MKLDDRGNALMIARFIINAEIDVAAKIERIADALMEAHLVGIDMARSAILQEKSLSQILTELDGRRNFILSQVPTRE